MRNKKVQISLFIILGTLLLFVLGIGFYFITNIREEKTKEIPATQRISLQSPVKNYLEECVKKVAVDSAYEFGQQQGYHRTPKPYLDANYTSVAYYYYKGKDLVPRIEVLEKELEEIINENLLIDCTDFSIFENLGFDIEFNDLNTTTKILNERVIVNVDYPLSIKKDNEKSYISKFSYTLPFRIGYIISVSNELVNSIIEEPYAKDLTLLLNFDVDVSVISYSNCSEIYVIVDNQSKIKESDDDFVFTFAVGFEDKYCKQITTQKSFDIKFPEIENNEPILEDIPYIIAEVNKPLIYRLKAYDADNDTLFYLTDSILKNHTHVLTGLINFTPKIDHIGIYLINATVVDIRSGLDSKQFYLEIK